MWRTSANGDEVEGTTDVIARLVAFKFSFTNGDGKSEIPPVPCLTGTVEYSNRWNQYVESGQSLAHENGNRPRYLANEPRCNPPSNPQRRSAQSLQVGRPPT